ncbi:MAG: thioester dehydrase [Gammaproteobacteria bacterium]|nr:thioester dehydrase [Gammaproteobacteria bacterium]MDH5592801.1 thioester dehydrase [Gammaproteobacteria bacterium]
MVTEPIIDSENIEDQTISLELRLPHDLGYLQGHFPDAPILPGVVQIDWAIAFAKRYLGIDGEFNKMENVKFKNIISPDALLNLTIVKKDNEKITFEYQSEKGNHSSGRIYFTPCQ